MQARIQSWLTQHCALGQNTALGAVLLRRGEALHTSASWPADQAVPPRLAQVAAAAVQRGTTVATVARTASAAEPLEVIAHPLQASGQLVGAVVVVVRNTQPLPAVLRTALEHSAQNFGQALQPPPASAVAAGSAPGLASGSASGAASGPESATASADTGAGPAARVLDWIRTAFEHRDLRTSATTLTATLAAQLRCSRVLIGLRHGVSTCVEAVSDGSTIRAERGSYRGVAAAMDEAIEDGATLVYPLAPDAAPRIVAAHAHLARRQGLAALCTVPLVHGQRAVGALLLERDQEGGFDRATLAALEAASPVLGAWFVTQHAAGQPLHRRAADTWRARWRGLREPGSGRFKLAAAAAALMLGLLLWLPAQREVRGDARLEGTVQRVLAAPGDGYLKQVMVRPGDTVAAGQVLVEFAGEDLQLERSRVQAELAGAQVAATEAMSRHERAQLAIHSARADELSAQLALIDQRIERSQMKAPFDAVVIAGDLAQSLGAPVRKGDALLTLAPANGFRAIVEVDDADVGQVRTGQGGSMVLAGHPHLALPLRVQRITPMATQAQGRNVFEIEVALDAAPEAASAALRPGMRGIARLHTGDMPRALGWTRDAAAWLRLAAWRWIG